MIYHKLIFQGEDQAVADEKNACTTPQDSGIECKCTYSGCPRHGQCCQCLHYHLHKKQLPACCFPPDVERTYDRSFKRFIETYS